MATRHRRLRILLVALAALSAADCRLPRASLPPRYWILTPLEAEPADARVERTLGLGPLELPAYLNRAGVVTRSGRRLHVARFDVWGQPLGENMLRVLGRNLELLAPGTSVVLFPWKIPSRELSSRVAIRVARFEADADRAVHLEASWDVRGSGTDLLGSGRASIQEPVSGDGSVEEITAAMSRALAELSRRIAAQLPAPG